MPTILLSNNTIKGYAGSELVTLDLAAEFIHRGYDVTIATFGKDSAVVKSLDELGVKWLDLNTEQPNVEKIVFDLIWAHHFTTLDAILMDFEITAKAIIFSSMSPYEPLESPPTYASQLSLVLANSEETRNQLLHYGLPLSMMHVFPNPVAREWFTVAKTASSFSLRKVAVVSNHVADELQDAIKYLQALGVLVEIFGVEHNFKQVTPTLLASFDCVVTIGRTVQQAMVLGLPVYCYDRFGGPGYLRTENFEKAGLFNYSGRCCECFKTAEEIATELVDGYQSAATAAPELQLIAHEKYRLDSAVSQVLEIIADNTLDLSIVSTALKLPLRIRKHTKKSEPNQLFAQLFLDNGPGFLESTSIRIPLNGIRASQSSRDLVFDLPDNHSLVNLRFDPLNAYAVITIHRAELLGPEGSVDLTDCIMTNAKDCSDNTHFFTDDDPQIIFADATFNGATHLKVSLTYQATGSEALKKFITQHEMRFASLMNVADSEQNYNQISQQLIENQAKSFTPIKEELIARIHEIASLNQQTSKRDEEISRINQANVQREQVHLAQLRQARQQIEAQLLQLVEREKVFSEQLQQLQLAHEQQKNEQSREHAEREQAHLVQLGQARQQIETQLLQLTEREKAFSEQLLKLQQAHEQQKNEQSREHAEREKTQLSQLTLARQQIDAYLVELTKREKTYAQHLQEIQQTHERQTHEQGHKHAEREKAHIAQLALARQKLETHLLKLAERERAFSEQLQKMQQTHEQQTSTQSQQHAEREQTLNDQLAARQHELRSQINRWAETEKAHALAVNDLHRELDAIRSTCSWRWTAPLRNLAAMLEQKKSDSSKTAQPAINDQVTNLVVQANETQSPFPQTSSDTINRIINMSMNHTRTVATTLEELLSYDDERFIHSAYHTLLNRAPDAEGMRYYLARVRTGISKVEILAQLSSGAEGKPRQIKVAGLNEAIRRHKQLRTPVLGALLRLIGVTGVEGDVQQSLRAFKNRGHIFNTQMLKGLTEVNTSLARLEQLVVPYNVNVPKAEKLDSSSNEKIEHIGQILPIKVVEPIESIESTEKNLPTEEIVEIKVQTSVKNEITREEFDAEWYLSQYPDVAKAGLDPYDHYMNSGRHERRLAMRKGSGYPQIAPLSDEDCAYLIRKIEAWPRKPLISILMPTYNSNEAWLRQAIDSVINQVYQNWELCIADDASPQPHVKQVLDEYQQRDSRIKVVYRDKNGRISAASNSALTLVTGEFTALFDHDDVLERHALFHLAESILLDYPDIIYSDELVVGEDSNEILNHVFRPMFSLELLRSHSYIVHLVAFRTEVLRGIGGFDESLNISQDYDLILRAVEKSKHIVHIPVILYRWRTHKASTGHSQKENVMEISKKILSDHLARCGEKAEVLDGKSFNFFETRYTLENDLRIAIIIPTKNHGELVRQCIDSIERTVSGIDYDIILIDHASDDKRSLEYFEEISNSHTVLRYEGEFNFSTINNWGVKQLTKNYSHYLLCNNDIEALHEGWLERMLELAQKRDIGIVGAKLYYAEPRTIQHAGVCVGMFGAAEHYGKFMGENLPDGSGVHPGYIGSLITNHEMSAVTAACMLIRRDVFEYVRGFDEHAKVGFGDVDLCLRVREAGYRIIFCPHAELIHHESISRGKSTSDPHPEDSVYFLNRWKPCINKGDPYYNPNLTLFNTYWSLKRSEEFQWEREKMQPRRSFRAIPN